ncbi:MAG TPA: NADPH dehydrogenase, partial [Parasutterella excrementihominis]|nr:NADPH dehydrogenase [Parasutterella excrementihominis]
MLKICRSQRHGGFMKFNHLLAALLSSLSVACY